MLFVLRDSFGDFIALSGNVDLCTANLIKREASAAEQYHALLLRHGSKIFRAVCVGMFIP